MTAYCDICGRGTPHTADPDQPLVIACSWCGHRRTEGRPTRPPVNAGRYVELSQPREDD